MSLTDYLATKRQLSTEYRAAKVACDADLSQEREICVIGAMGKDWIAKADLEVAYRSTARNRFEASAARADARFWLARERCTEIAQADRLGCLEAARTLHLAARDEAAAQLRVEEMDDVCASEVIAAGQSRSPACVLRAAEVRKRTRSSAP
ncbi:MAG TPA: hypothetical protein VMH32_17290 [Burkholderiales bacterium]|nr:hypothetical protein [Burkholderiales bacterium]